VSESENASAGRPGSFVRSLTRSLAQSHSPCRNLFRLRTFLLSRRLFLSGENRTNAGRRAGRQAGRRAGRPGAALRYACMPYLRRFCRKRAHPENYQRPAGRPYSRLTKNSILLEHRRRTLVSLPRLPLSPFSVSFLLPRSFTRPSRVSSLPPSLLTLSSLVFVSLTSRVSSLLIFVTRTLVTLSFFLPPSPSRFLTPSSSYQSTVCAAQTMHFFARLSRGPLSWEVEI